MLNEKNKIKDKFGKVCFYINRGKRKIDML